MRLMIAASLGLALTLAACGNEGAKAPGGVSEGEAKALEEAASMLDERRLPPEALPPEAQSPGGDPADLTGDTVAPDGE
ncbi:MAG TPA: hypothetical protein VK913_06695 [Erythrobacter sp.]|nr:hypothetical protein [Erythrobacter sp.]